jgi:quinol monooxygenase YgiN
MSISFVAALAGALAAAAGTVMLVVRCARAPRADLIAWAIATAGLTIALAAQVLGYQRGFAPITFRAVQLGAQLIAPLALAWGITEVAARSMPARFAARLLLSALAVVAAVILGTDPLSAQAFSQSWPAASVHYQVIPSALLTLLAVVAVLTAVAGAIIAGVRARSNRVWGDGFVAVGVAGAAILATEGLAVHLPLNSAYPAICVLAAGLAVLASLRAGRFQPAALRAASRAGDDTGWGPPFQAGARGSARYGADDSLGLYASGGRAADDSLGLYRDSGHGGYPAPAGGYGDGSAYGGYGDTGYGGSDADYDGPVTGAFEDPIPGGFDEPDNGGLGGPYAGGFDGPVTGTFDPLYQPNGYTGHGDDGRYGADADHPAAERSAPAAGEPAGVWRHAGYPNDENSGPDAALVADAVAGLVAGQDTERFYGQIAIYTLFEHGAAEFDRLAGQVVEQVRAQEPGTLVYVVHGVPSAPLQRILYEVYQDQAAYDEHTRQSYIQEFEVARRPLVLATNVIELGVRQAKVSPLGPSPGPQPPGPQLPGSRPVGSPPVESRPVGPPAAGPPYGTTPGGRTRGDRPPGGRAL